MKTSDYIKSLKDPTHTLYNISRGTIDQGKVDQLDVDQAKELGEITAQEIKALEAQLRPLERLKTAIERQKVLQKLGMRLGDEILYYGKRGVLHCFHDYNYPMVKLYTLKNVLSKNTKVVCDTDDFANLVKYIPE